MRRTSFSSVCGLLSSVFGQRQQVIVGDAAPQEERQARGQFEIAEAIRRPAFVGRIAKHAQQEIRIDQHAFERELNPVVETSAILPAVVEELQQRVHVRLRHGTPIGQPGHSAKESSRRRRALRTTALGGWHTKIARRLACPSRVPCTSYGPPIWTEPTFA